MTIKKSWTTNLPIFGKLSRTKVLRPGHTEIVVIEGFDEEFKSMNRGNRRLKVLSNDKISLEEVEPRGKARIVTVESFARFFAGEIQENEMEDAPREEVYEGKEINTEMLDARHEQKLYQPGRGFFDDKKIEIKWEPTLPSQARK